MELEIPPGEAEKRRKMVLRDGCFFKVTYKTTKLSRRKPEEGLQNLERLSMYKKHKKGLVQTKGARPAQFLFSKDIPLSRAFKK